MSRQIYAVYLKCLFSLVLLLSIGLPVLGQSSSSAAVNGIVQDTTDARIPNANVKMRAAAIPRGTSWPMTRGCADRR